MHTKFKLFISLSYFILISSCTLFEVQAPVDVDITVGPNTCDFVESFQAIPDPYWTPSNSNGCNGYDIDEDGNCLTTCIDSYGCDTEHYCIPEVGECFERIYSGECNYSEECLSDICMCGVCVDRDALIDFLGSVAIEGLSEGM